MPKRHPYIKFTGKYNELKKMGFEFQRLFANNYMQWCNEEMGIRVWKKGGDVTWDHDQDIGKVFEFLATKPDVRIPAYDDKILGHFKASVKFYKYVPDRENHMEFEFLEINEENDTRYYDHMKEWGKVSDDENYPKPTEYWSVVWNDLKPIEYIEDWMDKGWCELAYLGEDDAT